MYIYIYIYIYEVPVEDRDDAIATLQRLNTGSA